MTASGLPQRRRRSPNSARKAASARPGPAATAHEEPAPGVWMAELRSGLAGERPTSAPARTSNDTSDKGE
ncbi:hypothetical protein [Streptomyces sirii]|uniref:hypothetical protein n=1 Tax=Streptomyces sirii TaxID=3127701 RepID=UPI003D35F2F5